MCWLSMCIFDAYMVKMQQCFSIHGEIRFCGTPTNPITSDGVPGGCSSGSAVAGGMVDFNLDRRSFGSGYRGEPQRFPGSKVRADVRNVMPEGTCSASALVRTSYVSFPNLRVYLCCLAWKLEEAVEHPTKENLNPCYIPYLEQLYGTRGLLQGGDSMTAVRSCTSFQQHSLMHHHLEDGRPKGVDNQGEEDISLYAA